ncbi:MAG: SHOCT domain-containing protein [SAR324 cluster bacterium]|nr:SHOCT domain-containing protein [SAR324 cluster bacterium]
MMGGGTIGIILIAIAIWFIFQNRGKGKMNNPFGNNRIDRQTPDEDAMEILMQRYAKGEINIEEFERMKKELL